MIEVQALHKRYGKLTAVENVAFSASKGDVLGFLGPNGAGKTTTMRIITGFMPASEGKAMVAGFDVFDSPREVKKRIGYLPEKPPLYGDMIVTDYLDYVAELKGLDSRRRKESVAKAIEACALKEVANRLSSHLSKGYQQRLGIAQAIVNDPEVLVLDEPTIGLDPRQIVDMREMIKGLSGNRTIILSSHILSEVSQICNKVVIINRGKIVAFDTVNSLQKRLGGSNRVRLKVARASDDVMQALKNLPGVVSVTQPGDRYIIDFESGRTAPEIVAKTALDKGWGLLEVAVASMTLEEIFIHLIKEADNKAASIPAENKAEGN